MRIYGLNDHRVPYFEQQWYTVQLKDVKCILSINTLYWFKSV